MPEQLAGRLRIATLNTRGVPFRGTQMARRYAAIGGQFEAGNADVVCVQEVLTYWHLRRLARWLPSFRYVSFRPAVLGPAGGLVTFSRRPVSGRTFRPFGPLPKVPGLPRHVRQVARQKGALLTWLADPELCVVNTHPLANWDGDWSPANRFYPLHLAQLTALARTVRDLEVTAVVCGDFNVNRDSSLFADFVAETQLADAFEGQCPPTFRAEYLPAGRPAYCIDFILTAAGAKAESTGLLFTGRVDLPDGPGYASDHIGLYADLVLTPDGQPG